jgi:peptidoglycan hydrolase-like protein with peptidoglycan-binding domain
MGPQSEGVCFDFQRAEKLDVDGVIGPETWAAAFTPKVSLERLWIRSAPQRRGCFHPGP